LAGFLSPKELFSPLISLEGGVAVLGFLFLICTPLSKIKIRSTELGINTPIEKPSLVLLRLWIGQGLLFLLTFIFFNLVALQTQKSPQLQAIETSDFFKILDAHILTLGILPWFIFGMLGVGLAYFSVCKGETALLYRIILPSPKTKLTQFLHYYFWIMHEVVLFMPYLLLMGATILFLSEGLFLLLGMPSLLETPYRGIIFWIVILFSFRRSNPKILEWMREKQFSMGTRLAFYAVGFILLLVLFQATMQIFSFETESQGAPLKSPLAGSFSEAALNFRLMLLCWGWWGIWVPWMSSLIARYSVGFSVARAMIHAVILPLFIFYVLSQNIKRLSQIEMDALFQMPFFEILGGLICLLFIMGSLRKVYNFSQFTGGMMLPLGKFPKRALTKIISVFLVCLVTYIPASFALGWVPAQVIVSVSAAFILTMIIGFMVALGLELGKFILSSGYRAEY